ncbi:MAG: undecaprenyl-diphosphate phosphatase, partial [Alphaproteobacteria bacterium]|nr:undecaprenyl-diphosphate phosphatase [Alphaproteobacteria bacterium]
MEVYQILTLALVQGLTEFIPVSSSAHLTLIPALTGWCNQGLGMNVAFHIGTMIAIIVYFWDDVKSMLIGTLRLTIGQIDYGGTLIAILLLATPPALIAGYLIDQYAQEFIYDLSLIGWALIGFGILLYLCDKMGLTIRKFEHLTIGHALIIGFAQAFAFLPGVSRLGITISMARLLNYERTEAAKFSFLLSIPIIMASGIYKGLQFYRAQNFEILEYAVYGIIFSFIAGLMTISLMMQWM